MIKRWIGLALAAWLLAAPAMAAGMEVTVSAAASLQNAFVEIGKEFEKARAGTKVLFNFGASGQLVQQIGRGAPADVLATADLDTMDKAAKQNLIVSDTRANIASNTLVLVVPAEASASIRSISELDGPAVRRIALGTPESVPAGAYAKEALELAGKWDPLKDRYVYGQNVRQVLDYVVRAEVDAGFVYSTDALLMKNKVRVVEPVPVKRPILYPIAAVKGSGNEKGARWFIEQVRSTEGQRILAKHGFGSP